MLKANILPLAFLNSVWRNRSLIRALVAREIASRYRGSSLGGLWSLLNPLFMLVIYTFVFSVVFKARWNAGSESKTEFALMLFAGLMVFSLFSEVISRAPGLIVGNVNYVKKVVFPIEILPWVVLGSAFFQFLISAAVWALAFLVLYGSAHLSWLSLPLVVLPLLLLTVGAAWLLSAIGVYFRDIGQLVAVIIPVLMFMSPIFYPVDALPEAYQPWMLLNPLTPVIEQMRHVLFVGGWPDFSQLLISTLISGAFSLGGFAWFQLTRRGFADVL